MLVENVVWVKSGNHSQDGEHSEVEESSCGQTTGQKHRNTFCGTLMEFKQSLQVHLVMVVYSNNLCSIKDERSEARQEDMDMLYSVQLD